LTYDPVPVVVHIMLDTLKEVLAHQYEASLSTVNLAVARCPDALCD
jgi:hypothetical protein